MNFDIKAIPSTIETTYDVIVAHHPDAQGQPDLTRPVGFRVVGPESEAFRKAERELRIKGLVAAEKRKGGHDISTEVGAAAYIDDQDYAKGLLAQRCTVAWFGFMDGTVDAEFTAPALASVLAARPNWVKRINDAIDAPANFGEG